MGWAFGFPWVHAQVMDEVQLQNASLTHRRSPSPPSLPSLSTTLPVHLAEPRPELRVLETKLGHSSNGSGSGSGSGGALSPGSGTDVDSDDESSSMGALEAGIDDFECPICYDEPERADIFSLSCGPSRPPTCAAPFVAPSSAWGLVRLHTELRSHGVAVRAPSATPPHQHGCLTNRSSAVRATI